VVEEILHLFADRRERERKKKRLREGERERERERKECRRERGGEGREDTQNTPKYSRDLLPLARLHLFKYPESTINWE
jgi:hypothetical protein